VPAGQQGDEHTLEHRVLAEDDALGLVEDGLQRAGDVGQGAVLLLGLPAHGGQSGGVGAHRVHARHARAAAVMTT
jgi:hypothetical protein